MPLDRGTEVLRTMAIELARLSNWLDEANAHRDPEARTWGRMAKLSEETGEVVQEMIAFTGQNPRKPKTLTVTALIKENLDVAITALGNVEHLTGNEGTSMHRLLTHLSAIIARAENAGMKDTSDDELPGMWERSDFE